MEHPRYGRKALNELLDAIEPPSEDAVLLDCYNGGVCREVSVALTTRVADGNNYFVMERLEEPKLMPVGNACGEHSKSQGGAVYDSEGISQTICACAHGYAIGYVLVREEEERDEPT